LEVESEVIEKFVERWKDQFAKFLIVDAPPLILKVVESTGQLIVLEDHNGRKRDIAISDIKQVVQL